MRTQADLLAHGNGGDEAAFVVVPIVLFIAFVLWQRRANARREADDLDE